MLDLLIHAAVHKVAEAIGESEMGKKVGNTIDDALNAGVNAVGKGVKAAGKIAERGLEATAAGVEAAIKNYNKSK